MERRPAIGVIANKADVPVEKWDLDVAKIKQDKNLQGMMYMQVSALTGMNVDQMFTGLGEIVLDQWQQRASAYRVATESSDSDNESPLWTQIY